MKTTESPPVNETTAEDEDLVIWPKLLVIFFAFGAMLNWASFETPTANKPTPIEISEKNREFVFMQYETASTEIRMRIEDEASLYTYKFTVVGAVLGLLITGLLKSRFENKSPDAQDSQGIRKYVLLDSAVFYWVAAIMAALIDARIQFNAYLMGQLGGWIAMIETSLLANPDAG